MVSEWNNLPRSVVKVEKGNLKDLGEYISIALIQKSTWYIVGVCKDTEKRTGDLRKRQDFDCFPLASCCCPALMYDQLWYLELSDIHNNNNNDDDDDDDDDDNFLLIWSRV